MAGDKIRVLTTTGKAQTLQKKTAHGRKESKPGKKRAPCRGGRQKNFAEKNVNPEGVRKGEERAGRLCLRGNR